ncbi:FAD-dependent oxidoreductase [Leucobacter sp. M11]|uniref:FAD-dependent oxidoreductase n=1 Tax=Leucobacter sp. M11 TaxID=2993565 RepID=UPI002D898484|nr:NAD(P)/FAD-dependent oxidoreductase [Leucobacter sp. M11]
MNSEKRRVVVIGAGPAGLVAALSLRARGIEPLVVEAKGPGELVPGSRALFVHRESMAVVEAVSPGTGQTISEAGIMWAARETRYSGQRVFHRVDRRVGSSSGGIAQYSSLRQSATVAILREACEQAGIEIRTSCPVEAVDVVGNGVVLSTPSGLVLAERVIAADGARSVARKGIDSRLEGPRLDGHHVVVDLATPASAHPRSKRVLHYKVPSLEKRNLLIIPFAGGFQLDVQAKSKEDADRLRDVSTWLSCVAPEASQEDVSWVSTYRFTTAVATSLSDPTGRVLLVGEAAHLFPPFGARGMNSAIADAHAAAEAVAIDASTGSSAATMRFAETRQAAARVNAEAATRGFRVLHPSRRYRAAQWSAAQASRFLTSAGRWLEDAPFTVGSRTGGRY